MNKVFQFISGCFIAVIGLCNSNAWAQNADNWPENLNSNAINSAIFSDVFRDLGAPTVSILIRHSQENKTYVGLHPMANHQYKYLIRFPMNIVAMMKSSNAIDIYNYVVAGNEARIDGLVLNVYTATNETDYKLGRTFNLSATIKEKLKAAMRPMLKTYIDQMHKAYREAMKDDRSGSLTPIGTGATNPGSNTPTSGGGGSGGGSGTTGPSSFPGSSGSSGGGVFGNGIANRTVYP